MIITFCALHICRPLSSMIDSFGCHIQQMMQLDDAVAEWNILNAILRTTCQAIERCFFALQTAVIAAMILLVADAVLQELPERGGHLVALLPGAIITLGVARIFV